MPDLDDEAMMRIALAKAEGASAAGEAPIGAVLVDPSDGAIVAATANAPIGLHDPTAHAEILALRQGAAARGNYRLGGLWLYVTLEPCTMCAAALSHARIARVIYGAPDPKGGAVESGVRFFEQPTCHSRPAVTGGVLAEKSAALLRGFFRARR
jgi:tRNA(Arg) A34 adenosine deaminase TadA